MHMSRPNACVRWKAWIPFSQRCRVGTSRCKKLVASSTPLLLCLRENPGQGRVDGSPALRRPFPDHSWRLFPGCVGEGRLCMSVASDVQRSRLRSRDTHQQAEIYSRPHGTQALTGPPTRYAPAGLCSLSLQAVRIFKRVHVLYQGYGSRPTGASAECTLSPGGGRRQCERRVWIPQMCAAPGCVPSLSSSVIAHSFCEINGSGLLE